MRILFRIFDYSDRLDALVPPPRVHRHRYFGVLAPNSHLRSAVIALARAATTSISPPAPSPEPAAEPANRRAARYAWARLLDRIYEVFPLVCPRCGAEMRIITFLTDPRRARSLSSLGGTQAKKVDGPRMAACIILNNDFGARCTSATDRCRKSLIGQELP